MRHQPGVRVRLDGNATGNAFCLLELVLEPEDGAGFHTHTREDETIALIEGSLVIQTDSGTKALAPGDSVFLARGVRHAFRAGREGAFALVFATPAGLEGFFRALEAGARADRAAADAGLELG